MSIQSGNTLVAEATLDELELNIETLQDLEFDASQVKGGGGVYGVIAAPAPGRPQMSGTSVISSGTSVINPSGG